MRVKTDITGVTTTSDYKEGDCYSLVNLRKKNGTLHPVTPRKTEFELSSKYDIIFVHSFSDFENWIGVQHDTEGSDVYCNINENPTHLLYTNDPNYKAGKVISIEQIGNTLSLITENKILYLLHSESDYKVLGEIPEMEPIKWFNYGWHNGMSYKDEYPAGSITKDSFRSATIGLFNVLRKKIYDKYKGVLIDAHLMVFAFRLYDGSYIKQTVPVLLCGNLFYPAYMLRSTLTVSGGGFNITINSQKVYLEFDLSYLEGWEDIIKSVDVFLSPGLGKCSEGNMRSNDDFDKSFDEIVNLFHMMNDDGDDLLIKNIKENENFYLIDSIPVGTKSEFIDGSVDNLNSMFSIPKNSVLSDIDLLTQKETLPVDTFSHHIITGNISYAYNNRLHLAQIKTTLFQGFNFNFFLLPSRFLGESYFGVNFFVNLSGQVVVVNTWDTYPNGITKDLRFNGIKKSDYQNSYFGILIAVYLKIDGFIKTVYSSTKTNDLNNYIKFWINPYFSYPDTRAYKVQFYGIKITGEKNLIHEMDLTSSKSNNSFFLNAKPSTIDIGQGSMLNILAVVPPDITITNSEDSPFEIPDQMPSYFEPNKLKVSALNDPFLFPNETTYLVSNGKILNMESIAIRISEGQFGQFPLYVFTDKGIYSMQIGSGEVVYAQESAPTSFEIPLTINIQSISTTIVCSTPFGVIFTSERGICIISGQNVELLTAALQQPPKELKIILLDAHPAIFDEMLLNYGKDYFIKYLDRIESIIYDPNENELIIIDSSENSKFNWVMNFDSKQFYQSTEKIELVVKNTFPNLKVIEGMKVKDYTQSSGEPAHVSIISRPFLFGTTDFKNLERMLLRSTLLYPVDPVASVILNFYSIDQIKFFVLKGFQINPGNRKDFDMGLFSRSKYRQFMFAFAGILEEKSEIECLESEISQEYENTKMR